MLRIRALLLLVVALVAAGVGMGVAYGATRGFTAVPQVWDSVFHANATRYIAATGRSDPAALRNLNNPVATSYYYPGGLNLQRISEPPVIVVK